MAGQGYHTPCDKFLNNDEVSHLYRKNNTHCTQMHGPSQSMPPVSLGQHQHSSSSGYSIGQYSMPSQIRSVKQPHHTSSRPFTPQKGSRMYPISPNNQTQDVSLQRRLGNTLKTNSHISEKKPAQRELDLGKLFISMAEEYFEAGYQLTAYAAHSLSEDYNEKRQKLVALGLGCLETALKRVTGLDPRDEACIRLRYAGVLFEETENAMEAETALSIGIELCERNHYYDLKYSMYFLLAQCVAKSNIKASMKALDTHISEVETFSNISWVYAFRFLRASYSLECSTFIDNNAAVRNLRAISLLAEQRGDRPIHFVASLMIVIAYLRISGPEASQNLKSSMATVWSHQTDASCCITPLIILAHTLDLACCIREGDPQTMMNKLQAARSAMDTSIRNKDWSSSDIISIPIPSSINSSHVVSPDSGNVFNIGDNGADNLIITLLDQKGAYCISCLLYGVVLLNRSANERLPALKYLYQGLSILEKDDDSKSSNCLSNRTSSNLAAKHQWRVQILCYIRTYIAFCHSLSAEWSQLKICLENLQKAIDNLEVPMKRHFQSLIIYLSGVYYQGSGDLDTALEIFQDSRFKLPAEKTSNISSIEQMEFDIAILAGLNALLILQHQKWFDPVRNKNMLNMLEPVCLNHANQDIVNAFNLAMVTVKTNSPKTFIEIKHHLSAALNGAKKTNNSQLLSITVTLMFSTFFVGRIGKQAENGAQAASRTAARSGNPLWMSVTDNLLAQCNELHGKAEDAKATMALALESAGKLSLKP
ncbi:putative cohesin loading factor [Erysiphe neolycopersici]|uniref:Putative cohesin loading factor n=1 Tax=Erysiphe neolycopersici TaxID=212602 RepID=A0A420HXZ6_9PEZI|nr:putative cohesin loading factor [Erysiphe neolycopersici]